MFCHFCALVCELGLFSVMCIHVLYLVYNYKCVGVCIYLGLYVGSKVSV